MQDKPFLGMPFLNDKLIFIWAQPAARPALPAGLAQASPIRESARCDHPRCDSLGIA
jgi:hypothetical protein